MSKNHPTICIIYCIVTRGKASVVDLPAGVVSNDNLSGPVKHQGDVDPLVSR